MMDHAIWTKDGKELLFYPSDRHPDRDRRNDNMQRMMCPCSPFDFILDNVRMDFDLRTLFM